MMSDRYRIIHCLNQFFGGLGGETEAGLAPVLQKGSRGPGQLLERLFPGAEIAATLICGDNYMATNTETALEEALSLLAPYFTGAEAERPSLLMAGPAFAAGRYGIACGAICQAIAERFGIPALTGMFPENPAVSLYRKEVLIVRTAQDVMGMEAALRDMASLAGKLLRREEILPEQDNYLVQGRRRNVFDPETGARRAVRMLLQKMRHEPFVSEYAMPTFDRVTPAAPVADMGKVRLALVTSGGIVPQGNPDRIQAASAQSFGTYPLKGLSALSSVTHQSVHGGYDPTWANADPNRVLPLDAVRELETEGAFGSLHEFYYATVGNATSVAMARSFGREIAQRLLADGVQAVILTST